ncbi:unnamed protein product [Aspergillus oryzae]|nr:unnamed protein product [Aspergillus oryzae]GMF83328.1 unnamed protein product [Aspergillus oryzae]
MSVSRSSISSSHPSTSGTVVDLPQCSSVSGTGDTNSAQETDPSLRHIIGLLTPFSGEQSLSVDPGLLWGPQDTEPPSEIENPVLRVYTSEKDIANAYYIYIHPYLALLPASVSPQYDDRLEVFQPPAAEAGTVDQSCLPYWPTTSLSLALSAILCLIPPPQDPQPSGECHVWMRRAYARLYAQAALSIAEKEIDDLVSPNNLTSYAEDDRLHNELPFQLYPVLALVALSVYELHRFRAFMDIPLFVEKHCDLTAINDKAPYPEVSSNFEAVFPFTEQQSSVRCLKSSLSVARAFRNLPRPQPSRSAGGSGNHHSPAAGSLDIPSAVSSTTLGATSPSALPYFKCTAMQASYSMFMLVHRIRAAIASNRLSVCYPLMASPEPATEIQDARRLIEELRHAIECLKHSMERDMVFEGIAAMCRGLTAVYLSVFQTDYFEQEVSRPPARQQR